MAIANSLTTFKLKHVNLMLINPQKIIKKSKKGYTKPILYSNLTKQVKTKQNGSKKTLLNGTLIEHSEFYN